MKAKSKYVKRGHTRKRFKPFAAGELVVIEIDEYDKRWKTGDWASLPTPCVGIALEGERYGKVRVLLDRMYEIPAGYVMSLQFWTCNHKAV